MANNQKNVDLVINAKDNTKAGVQSATTALQRFATAQKATANRRAEIASAQAATAAYQANAKAVRDLANEISTKSRPRKAMVAEFEAAKEAARQSKIEMDRLNGSLRGVSTSARGSFAAFEASVRALNDQSNSAARAEGNIENLNSELPRMAAAQNQATRATNANAAALTNQARAASLADKTVAAYGSRQGRGPLGLRPYELQNLGYQVNDLVTQISSGTPITQAFAQQAGQIIQIFPKFFGALFRFFPLIAAAAAAIGTLWAAFTRVTNVTASQKQFERQLAATASAATYNAQELAKTAQALDEYGGSLEDARASLNSFIKESVDPTYLTEFGEAARDLAKVMGVEIPEASEKVAKAFTGNYDDIKELDDAFNFLSVAERKHIRELFESGKASEARTKAFEIFERKMSEGAAKMNGPWSNAIDNVANAWRGFLDWLGNTSFIQGAIRLVDDLGEKVKRLTSLLPGANGAAGLAEDIAKADARLAELRGAQPSRLRDGLIRSAQAERDRLAARQQADNAPNAADPRNANDPRAQKEDEDARLEAQAKLQERLNSLAKQRADELARQRERQQDFLDDLKSESDEREFQIGLIDQTERQQAIATALREAQLKAEEVGVTLSEAQLEAIQKSVGALYDAEQAAAARLKIDQLALAVAEQRGEVESREDYVAREARDAGFERIVELDKATGEYIVRLSQEEQAYRRLLGEQYDLMQAARDREALEKSVNDQMKLRETLMESIAFYQEQGDTTQVNALKMQLDGVNATLLTAIDNLIAYFAKFQTPEAMAALQYWKTMRDQIAQVDQKVIVTGKDINEGIANVGVSAFDKMAEAIANGGNAWSAFIDGFRQAAAEFLRQIAQMIIQQAILNALGGGPTGGGGVGGTVAGWINGLFRHDGGMVGSGGGMRAVSPAAFAGAMRYHSGGIAGLKPNEVPAVLERGEEVLTADDPRHRANGGMGGESAVNIKQVNVIDGPDVLSNALADERGQRVILNYLRANSRAVQGALAT